MSAEAVQSAIIDILRADTNIHDEFNIALTGTVTFTQTSDQIVGIGTLFTEELEVGDWIKPTTSTAWYRVSSIEDDTNLTLEVVFAETTESGVIGYESRIKKGMGRGFNYQEDVMGIRVYLMVENIVQSTVAGGRQDGAYPFLVITLFYEPDEEIGEERKTQYADIVRRAIERDHTLGGNAYETEMGDVRFYFHPNIEGSYYFVLPVTARRRETVG